MNEHARWLILFLPFLHQLELFIKKSGGPFVGGAKPSIADFAIIGCDINRIHLHIHTHASIH